MASKKVIDLDKELEEEFGPLPDVDDLPYVEVTVFGQNYRVLTSINAFGAMFALDDEDEEQMKHFAGFFGELVHPEEQTRFKRHIARLRGLDSEDVGKRVMKVVSRLMEVAGEGNPSRTTGARSRGSSRTSSRTSAKPRSAAKSD